MLRNSASGPDIELPGRISAGFKSGKPRHRPSGRLKAGRRTDFEVFRPEGPYFRPEGPEMKDFRPEGPEIRPEGPEMGLSRFLGRFKHVGFEARRRF